MNARKCGAPDCLARKTQDRELVRGILRPAVRLNARRRQLPEFLGPSSVIRVRICECSISAISSNELKLKPVLIGPVYIHLRWQS